MANKLELTWYGKDKEIKVEPRILIENKDLSNTVHDKDAENMLIHGDNLLALEALLSSFEGKIKCIYIDPPYNTGNAFEYYNDNLEHSIWLNLMSPRFKTMKRLLADDGSIWVNLDDNEAHYCKVLLDSIFGRNNFLCDIAWEKRYSPPADIKDFGWVHDHILVYRKTPAFVRNLLPFTDDQVGRYKNPDNDPRGPWKAADYTCRYTAKQRPNLYYPIIQPITGEEIWPKETRVWANSKEEHEKNVRENRLWWGKSGKNRVPAKKNYISDIQQGMMPMSLWHYQMAGTNQDAKKESMSLFGNDPFPTPKPEKLIQCILTIATNPNDIVLDSFLGSGTTVAVSHKMGRRYIGVEMGEHAYTHCKTRLDKVIDGDQGGISKALKWQGGGGYRFYELAPTLIKKDSFDEDIINPEYDANMLASAVALHEGFTYEPDSETFWKQARGSEKSYLFTTTRHLDGAFLDSIKDGLKDDEFLIIACKSYQAGLDKAYSNIVIKKIPQMLLDNCEFDKSYDLNIICPPEYEDEEDCVDE